MNSQILVGCEVGKLDDQLVAGYWVGVQGVWVDKTNIYTEKRRVSLINAIVDTRMILLSAKLIFL